MQPNQQNSNNQNQPIQPPQPAPVRLDPYGRPLPFGQTPPPQQGIPEYLHMDPVTVPKTRKKPIFAIVLILILVIIGVAGAYAYIYMSQQSTPKNSFYQALDKQMQVNYVSREYVDTDTLTKSTTSITAESNLSNPAKPASYIKYTRTEIEKDSTKKTVGGENIVDSNTEYKTIVKIDDFKSTGSKKLAVNQWYRVPLTLMDQKTVSYNLSTSDSRPVINSTQGTIITGNYTNEQRQKLLNAIKTQNVYSLVEKHDQSDNGRKLTVYKVSLNRTALNKLNKQAAELVGDTQIHQISTAQKNNDQLQFWIDDKSGKIVRMNYVVKNSKNEQTFEKNINFSYPASVAIINPTNVKELPK